MTRRKGEIARGDPKRKWLVSARDLSRRSTPGRDDSDFVVLCFVKPADAEAFAKRFGGNGCPRRGDEGPCVKCEALKKQKPA
jgi:hypothetical protein